MAKVTIKFKTDVAAEEFAANFSMLNDTATVKINESTAAVYSDDPRTIRFIKHTTDRLAENTQCRNIATKLLKTITECISDGESKNINLMNNDIQIVSVKHAEAFANVYDKLNEENQTAFLVLASENKHTYEHAVNFAKANEENE
jgi:hypothetical protein